jgi:multisubunit Na+/H+ antiporter MnhB subunit
MKYLRPEYRPRFEKTLIIILVSVFTGFIIFALLNQATHDNQLSGLAIANLDNTGVSNPVTAVLLNYRAFDTFMEFAVFLCVAIALLPYILDTPLLSNKLRAESQVLLIAKVFIPLTIIMAGYLLWIGSSEPGGAFQAAALLSGCLVLMSLANLQLIDFTKMRYRLLMAAGLIVFLVTILVFYIETHTFLAFPKLFAGASILIIEFFATFAVALTLFLCFESIDKGHL